MSSLYVVPRSESVAESVVDKVLRHALRASSVRAAHVARAARYIEREEPIELVLPAFPAKSPNPEKTLGVLPDLGEVLALRFLNGLCEGIVRIYAPGARVVICSDGRVFSDLVRVSDQAVNTYASGIQGIIARYRYTNLSTFNLEDVFPGADYDGMRANLVGEFAEPVDAVRERVKASDEDRELFNGIHRFLFEDQLVLDGHLSRNQVRLRSKQTAYEVVQRSNAWSRLVESRFPHALRLSIHPQAESSMKIGIRLVPGGTLWSTPWHGVALDDGAGFRLVKRREAEAMRAQVAMADGAYPYYVLQGVAS